MSRTVGTVSRGIRCPIIREGDDLVEIVVESILEASSDADFTLHDRDIVALTESILARAQGNYASIDAVSKDLRKHFPKRTIGVVFPILSRNRFETVLKAIAQAFDHVIVQLKYPSDEVGNALISLDQLDQTDVNPYSDVLSLESFREHFGKTIHPFTHVDYIETYQRVIEGEGAKATFVFANHAHVIQDYTQQVLVCNIHERERTKRLLVNEGLDVLGLDDILKESVDGSGYNPEFGLLGCNKSSENEIKLFPRESQSIVEKIQKRFLEVTGKHIEVMVYGDGAFKDPIGQIWELADPTVSPGYTKGLEGTPNEMKLKYLADNEFKDLSGEALSQAILTKVNDKGTHLEDLALGTTPRRIVDLVGSLCDLTSGSGDKGTPIIHIQGYFDNYASK